MRISKINLSNSCQTLTYRHSTQSVNNFMRIMVCSKKFSGFTKKKKKHHVFIIISTKTYYGNMNHVCLLCYGNMNSIWQLYVWYYQCTVQLKCKIYIYRVTLFGKKKSAFSDNYFSNFLECFQWHYSGKKKCFSDKTHFVTSTDPTWTLTPRPNPIRALTQP